MLRATLGGFSMGRKFKPAEGSNIQDILRMPREVLRTSFLPSAFCFYFYFCKTSLTCAEKIVTASKRSLRSPGPGVTQTRVIHGRTSAVNRNDDTKRRGPDSGDCAVTAK